MANVNYEYYRLFYYVGKYRGITRAADVLRMSQPNLTRALNRMEEELGCKLLVRGPRGVTLTPEGEALYAHVEVAMAQIRAGEDELTGITALEHGTLTIGASETALNLVLLDRLRAFHRRYPGIRLRIANHSTPQAIQALGRGLIDLCVVTTPAAPEPGMSQTLLDPFREIMVAGQDFKSLKGRRWALAELQNYPLICLGSETMTYAFYNRFYLQCGLVLRPDTEAATADQILPLVKSGLGLGFVPEHFAESALAAGEVFAVELREKIPTRRVVLIRDTSRALTPAARAFAQMLCPQAGEEPDAPELG